MRTPYYGIGSCAAYNFIFRSVSMDLLVDYGSDSEAYSDSVTKEDSIVESAVANLQKRAPDKAELPNPKHPKLDTQP